MMRRHSGWAGLLEVIGVASALIACGSDEAGKGAPPSPSGDGGGSPDTTPSPLMTTTGTANVNGAELYYEERGTGEAVVLVHGFTLDTRMWDAQFEALSTAYRVIRFDMRGHGQSSGAAPTESGPATFSQADDLLGLLDFLAVDRAHIVGLSMGGYVAYEFAVDHPDRLSSLSLVDSAWRYDATRMSEFQMRIVGYLTTGSTDLEAGLRAWAADPLFAPAAQLPDVWTKIEQIVLGGHLAQGQGAFFRNLNAVAPVPLAETRLGELNTGALVIVGELDDPEFIAHADDLSARIAGAERVTIAGAGHMSPMEKPADVTGALEEFLARQ